MTRLLLIRHGESRANKNRTFAGQVDPELTELGHQQAQCTAAFIKETYTADAAYASDLQRAYQTGLYAAEALGLPLIKEPGFREICGGQWEGRSFDSLLEENSPEHQLWRTNIGLSQPPGGEAVAALADRIWETLQRVCEKHPDQTLIIATHATPIRVLQWRMSGEPLSYMQQIPWVSNASVTELIYDNGTLIPVKVSQDAHLSHMITKLPSNI
jgi:broad specificity phosphatase PhoE